MINVLITLSTAGTDSGPFNIYSNVNGYTSAFETGVTRAQLLSGFPSAKAPDGTTSVRIKSMGICSNQIDVPVVGITSTTSSSSTTTTTTTLAFNTYLYSITVYNCSSCLQSGSGNTNSLTPLEVGKYYYFIPLASKIRVDALIQTSNSGLGTANTSGGPKDTCVEVICS